MRRDPQQRAALTAGLSHTPDVAVLDVANATVDDLEGIGGRCVGEIASLDDGNRKATTDGIPRETDPEDSASDNDYVVSVPGQRP